MSSSSVTYQFLIWFGGVNSLGQSGGPMLYVPLPVKENEDDGWCRCTCGGVAAHCEGNGHGGGNAGAAVHSDRLS